MTKPYLQPTDHLKSVYVPRLSVWLYAAGIVVILVGAVAAAVLNA